MRVGRGTAGGAFVAALAALALGFAAPPAAAQSAAPPPPQAGAAPPAYKPPLRGAPGGRVGGASRGTIKVTTPLPTIDLLAPDGESGETTSPAPTLYFSVSRLVANPTRFTISAPMQPAPLVETAIPSPAAPGIYAVRLADYRVRLEPGTVYTWSISIVLDPQAPSRDIVASASLLRVAADPGLAAALQAASPDSRAAVFAQAGLWYDAVAAAAASFDRGRALGTLMHEVGLAVPDTLAPAATAPAR